MKTFLTIIDAACFALAAACFALAAACFELGLLRFQSYMVFQSITDKRPILRDPRPMKAWLFLALCASANFLGCESQPKDLPSAIDLPRRDAIIAQGQILPAGGIVQLTATPGDVVATMLVAVGDHVSPGQSLLEMRSQAVSEARLRTLLKRREEAARERKVALMSAERQLAAAELKLQHVHSQQQSLERKTELLDLAKEQVLAAESVLQKLESIAANAATSQFVGRLEIDQQRIALGETRLNYRQQTEAHQQALQDLGWAAQVAEAEREAAKDLLKTANASQALEILDLEIEAVNLQDVASRITAPISGFILAINASEGESSLPRPLVELANLDALVVEVEINELDAALVEVGQPAKVTARALGQQVLKGQVARKFNLVGRPQLRSPDPLARADYRTVTALVELDESSTAVARDWIQLQVEAEIFFSGTPGADTRAP